MKAIIVEDEFLARQRILKLLENFDDVQVVAEAKNADQAVEVINEREPDLVFLDIQMPGNNGFSVLDRIEVRRAPVIIFTTAFDQYALDAFKVHALDYLLKPFDEERFKEAIERAMQHLKLERSSKFSDQLMNLMKFYDQEESEFINHFKLKEKGRELVVTVDDILYLETAGNYVILHTLERQYLYRATMNALEEQLNPDEFFRIHRSYLLNKRFVKSHAYAGGNEFRFVMKNGKEITSAKSYKDAITNFLDLYF